MRRARAGTPPSYDRGWIGLFRRFPIGVRIFLVVLINIVGLVLVAIFIGKGASGVDTAGAELQRVRRIERVFTDIDGEIGRIQSLIQRYFTAPSDPILADIDQRKDILFKRIVDAYPYDDDISDEIRRAGETTRRLMTGFTSLREVNDRIRALYSSQFLEAAGVISRELMQLDVLMTQRNPASIDMVHAARDSYSSGLLEANTFYLTRQKSALAAASGHFQRLMQAIDAVRGVVDDAGMVAALDQSDAGLKNATTALDKLSEAFDQQARYMSASIDGNQAALASGIERVAARIQTREAAAQDQLESALAAMRQRVVVVGLLFLGASVFASLAIASSIGRPINELRSTMLAIVGGDYERIIRGVAATDEIGAMARAVEVFRENIIARRQAEMDREAQERRWRSLLETSPIGVSVLSAESGARLYANQKFRSLFGVAGGAGERVRERSFHEHFAAPQDAVRLSEAVKRFGAVSGWEVRMRRADGSTYWWCLMEVRPIEFEGRPAHIFWYYDVTDRRRAEDELRAAKDAAERALIELEDTQESLVEAEKLAAIGGLVAGVAHEVNNPVGISLTVASSLRQRTDVFAGEVEAGQLRKSRLAEFIETAREASTQLVSNLMRAADLVQSFKQVAVDRVHAERRAFDLRETIDQILSSLRPSLKSATLRLTTSVEDDIEMESYPGQLGQVVTNLFMNALIHAFDDGVEGEITITGRRIADGRVEIVCADTGRGMDDETKKRAFEPFFTTRRGQGGTGLGLHIVYNIVTLRLGGTISLESSPGHGTRFVIELPQHAPVDLAADDADRRPSRHV